MISVKSSFFILASLVAGGHGDCDIASCEDCLIEDCKWTEGQCMSMCQVDDASCYHISSIPDHSAAEICDVIHNKVVGLEKTGNDHDPADAFPLGNCQGDCDRSSDCEGDLKCFQRSEYEAVPGCSGPGGGDKGVDYCYEPQLLFVGNDQDPAEVFPLEKCQGDCDRNSDCKDDLKCFKRSDYEAVPGCAGTGEGDEGTDYCYDPHPVMELSYVGDDNEPKKLFPLGKCQGDCDRSSDCEGHLRCFQRSASEAVPGCSGTGIAGKDYCYDPYDVMGDVRRGNRNRTPKHKRGVKKSAK